MNNELSVAALGAGAPYPRPGVACSGLLHSSGDTHIWVDAGGGTLANLQVRIPLGDVAAIWISHLHADHLSDLPLAYYAWLMADPALPRIRVFGPPGLTDRVEGFLRSAQENRLDRFWDVVELTDGFETTVGGVDLTAGAVDHGVPSFGLRASAGGRSIVYSGDAGPGESLVDLARGADVLICEVGASAPSSPAWHCTPEDAGSVATRAGVRSLALYHLAPDLSEAEALRRAATVFTGDLRRLRQGEEL